MTMHELAAPAAPPAHAATLAHCGLLRSKIEMLTRALDGKVFAWWLAYPCESREAAYLLENGLLAARKPPLNVKAGR